MKKFLRFSLLVAAVMGCLSVNAQTVKLKGVYENNRYDDHADHWYSEYVGYNSTLQKSIFIVENGIYLMEWDGATLTTPVKEPAVVKSDFYSN